MISVCTNDKTFGDLLCSVQLQEGNIIFTEFCSQTNPGLDHAGNLKKSLGHSNHYCEEQIPLVDDKDFQTVSYHSASSFTFNNF